MGYVAQMPTGLPEAAVGALLGLAPNIDYLVTHFQESPQPTLRRWAEKATVGGLTHSAVVMLPLAATIGLILAFATSRPALVLAALSGVLSHLLLDIFGRVGVQLWAPLSEDWIVFPPWERWRPRRGSLVGDAIFALGTLLLLLEALRHHWDTILRLWLELQELWWRGAL
jgi:hypothetical protein